MALGVNDMFTIAFILRLLTGLFSVAALAAFARALLPTIAGDEARRFFIRYLPLFGFLPYLFVRTASETFSAAFFALAMAAVLNSQSPRRMALAGLLCGLAFESRYQTALAGAGPVRLGWRSSRARASPALAAFIGGGLGGAGDRRAVRSLGLWRLGVSALRLFQRQYRAGRGGEDLRARAGLRLSLPAAGAPASSPSPWW